MEEMEEIKKTFCPFCHLVVAPHDSEIIFASQGKAHFYCAMYHYVELGMPRPDNVSKPWEFKNFLINQAEKYLFNQKYTKRNEKKMQIILQAHEELFGESIKISSLIASA